MTDGVIDKTTATLNGNLYISGRDPMFNFEHGVAIADALNKLGIRSVTGDLIVTDSFVMSYGESHAAFGTGFARRRSTPENAAPPRRARGTIF